MFCFHDDIVYFSHCKGTTYNIPQFPKRHVSARTCELLRVIYPQIFIYPQIIIYPQILTDSHAQPKSVLIQDKLLSVLICGLKSLRG